MIDFNIFKKLPKNVVDLGKLIVAKDFKKWPNLVTLYQCDQIKIANCL